MDQSVRAARMKGGILELQAKQCVTRINAHIRSELAGAPSIARGSARLRPIPPLPRLPPLKDGVLQGFLESPQRRLQPHPAGAETRRRRRGARYSKFECFRRRRHRRYLPHQETKRRNLRNSGQKGCREIECLDSPPRGIRLFKFIKLFPGFGRWVRMVERGAFWLRLRRTA